MDLCPFQGLSGEMIRTHHHQPCRGSDFTGAWEPCLGPGHHAVTNIMGVRAVTRTVASFKGGIGVIFTKRHKFSCTVG